MTPSFATLREGDEIGPRELTPDLTMVIRYCGAIWNFPPFFFDVEAARRQGMPGTIIPGPLKVGMLQQLLEEWLGDAGFVRQVRGAHRRPDTTKRPLTLAGRVVRVYEDDGHRLADCECMVINEDGQPSVRAFAVVEFV